MRVVRVLLEEKLGRPIRSGFVVMHSCDNPPCCNPAHLEEGTQGDNIRQAKARGRNARGESHGLARLTEEQVRQIRIAEGSYVDIARQFGVSRPAVSMIRLRRRWAHVE